MASDQSRQLRNNIAAFTDSFAEQRRSLPTHDAASIFIRIETVHSFELKVNRSEDDERSFWATHDTADYFDYAKAQPTLMPNLRPTLKTVSLRLPESLVESIQVLAHKKDVPYQSLMKILLSEGVERELSLRGESATG